MKKISLIIAVCLIATLGFCLTACADTPDPTLSITTEDGTTLSAYISSKVYPSSNDNVESYNLMGGYEICDSDGTLIGVIALATENTNTTDYQFSGNTGEERQLHFVLYTRHSDATAPAVTLASNDTAVEPISTVKIGTSDLTGIYLDENDHSLFEGVTIGSDGEPCWQNAPEINGLTPYFNGAWAFEYIVKTTESITLTINGLK